MSVFSLSYLLGDMARALGSKIRLLLFSTLVNIRAETSL